MKSTNFFLFLFGLSTHSFFCSSQSADKNYILTRTMLQADGSRYMDEIQYYDGLGRLLYTSEVKDRSSVETLRNSFSTWLVTESFTTGPQSYPQEDTGYSKGFYHQASTKLLNFYVQDHQGNNRVVLDKKDSIMQVNHYYWQEGDKDLEGYSNLGSSASIQLGDNSYFNAYQNAGI